MKCRKLLFAISFLLALLTFTVAVSAADADFTPGTDAVYFVSNTAGADTNAGTSADTPLKTLSKVYTYLREVGGGTIVICGNVAISSSHAPSDIGGAVIFTSVYNGVDYRETADAKITIGAAIGFNNDTYFENIDLSMTASKMTIAGRCHNLGFGEGVNVTNDSGLTDFVYPRIIGGWNNPGTLAGSSNANDYTIIIKSGTWASVNGGNRRTSASQPVSGLAGDISLIISGGTFNDIVSVTGMSVHTGRAYLEISGGTFNSSIAPIGRLGTMPSDAASMTDAEFTADVLVRISGGTFNGRFRLAESAVSTTAVTYPPKGDATVVVSGGTFNSDFVGYGVLGSVLLKYDASVLAADKIKGFPVTTNDITLSEGATEIGIFANLLGDKPDPYVVEKDGIYYYCFSSGTTVDGTAYAGIKVAAHGNVPFGELSTQLSVVWNASLTDIANAKSEYWAPEIHYFDADTVGTDNAGWYIYFAADDGDNVNHRMYVLRASDPENPLSRYEMIGQITDSTNKWAIDGTVMTVGGKLYFVWSGWEGDTNVAQNIYIAEMSDPWTISSERVLLSAPTYDWETQDTPDVNEGPQILRHNGTTHIIYSASGSWTEYYCYGALTLTGSDPLDASSWYKSPTALFSSGNGMYGTGHGSFVQGINDEWWMIYHANPSLDIPEDSSWWAERNTYAKEFTFTEKTLNGVAVSYPVFGTPASHDGTQSLTVRTADYHADGEHLYSPYYTYVSGAVTEIARQCCICGAYDVQSVTFEITPTFSLESTLDTVTVSWLSVEGATGYRIYRKAPGEDRYSRLAEISANSESIRTYTDKELANGSRYCYLMHASYTDLTGNYQYIATGGKEVYTGLATPTVTAVQETNSGIRVTVSPVDGADEYVIYRRVNGLLWNELATVQSTAYVDTDISTNYDYSYKAVAKNANVASEESAAVELKAEIIEFNYEVSEGGDIFDAMTARASGGEITLLECTSENGSTEIILPVTSVASTEYIYSITGDFITPIVEIGRESDYYAVTVVNADADAIVFSDVPLVTYGDATGDGKFSLVDVLRVIKLAAGDTVEVDKAACDLDANLDITVSDAIMTLRKVLES